MIIGVNLIGITLRKGRKPQTCIILYDSIYMAFLKRQDYHDRNQISGCQGLGVLVGKCDYKGQLKGDFGGR